MEDPKGLGDRGEGPPHPLTRWEVVKNRRGSVTWLGPAVSHNQTGPLTSQEGMQRPQLNHAPWKNEVHMLARYRRDLGPVTT